MCIIQGVVQTVAKTKILVAPLQDGRQLTVYSNEVRLQDEAGAMILPFPMSGSGCEFFDLTAYPTLFDDLARVVPLPKSLYHSLSFGVADSAQPLAVIQVGSYKASIALSLKDLERIDTSVFNIKGAVRPFLGLHYAENYGFVICQLDHDKAYHPFGYIHKMQLEQMFIPTMHYHQHSEPMEEEEETETKAVINHADWDHDIYTWNRNLGRPAASVFDMSRSYLAPERLIQEFDMDHLPSSIEPPEGLWRYHIKHYPRNHDLWTKPSNPVSTR